MEQKFIPVVKDTNGPLEPVLLPAEPEPIEIDLKRMAVLVIDMQNAFVSTGGLFDLLGKDVSRKQKIIEPIKRINDAARARGVKVIHVVVAFSPDLRESGGPNLPYWYKAKSLISCREHPDWQDELLIRGSKGAAIVRELTPQDNDIVIEKHQYSAFFETHLDTVLKTHNIKYLVFLGEGTPICVEASLRDAFYLGYFCVLVSDATATASPPITQDTTESNVKSSYGWVTTTENLLRALKPPGLR